ncbi:MAG: peptide chain release factor 1 [Deltaproteobacteria bacterium RIFCSPHIGHO2_02_FULL_40_11]|nr:MAG: peptide chain release factor 1 [Deltaproteobacteria bacterium RIFCSPHIGHO2_02_FULL_40_11]
MDPSYLTKLEKLKTRFQDIEKELLDPKIASNPTTSKQLMKERAQYIETIEAYDAYLKILADLESNQEILKSDDEEMRALAQEELDVLEQKKKDLEEELTVLLLPKDPLDEKNVMLEIRAGTGGDEASLFAAELFRMYSRYAEIKRWKVEILSGSSTGVKGLKEVIAMISGDRVYSHLKFESGVHRVQRVPKTESQGRVHTSAVTVAVLPEADEVEVELLPQDLKIDVYRSSGPGGQSVNTTDSAVRITHIPSGVVVSCQDEKSQHKNKAKALKILRSRLYDFEIRKQQAERSQSRKSQIGSGDRSEKIRTYNFPQSRVTDHRIGLTLHSLDQVMGGDLDLMIPKLQSYFQNLQIQEDTQK